MNADETTRETLGAGATGNVGLQIDRRDLLLGAGTTAAVGLSVAGPSQAKAAVGSPGTKIDAHTHFTPLKYLDFAEKAEGRPFGLSPLMRSKPRFNRRPGHGLIYSIIMRSTCTCLCQSHGSKAFRRYTQIRRSPRRRPD